MEERKSSPNEKAKQLNLQLTNITPMMASQDEDTRKQGLQEYQEIMKNLNNHSLIIFILTHTNQFKIYTPSVVRYIEDFINANHKRYQTNPRFFHYILQIFNIITRFLTNQNYEFLYTIYWDSMESLISTVLLETKILSYEHEDPQNFIQFIEKAPENFETLLSENPEWGFKFLSIVIPQINPEEHLEYFLEKFQEFFTDSTDSTILKLAIPAFFSCFSMYATHIKDYFIFTAVFNIYEEHLQVEITDINDAYILMEICRGFISIQNISDIPNIIEKTIKESVPALIKKGMFLVQNDLPVADIIPLINIVAKHICEENYEQILSIDDLFPFLFLLMKIEDDNNFDNPYQKYLEYYSEYHSIGENQRENASCIILKLINFAGIETIINILPDLQEDYFEEYAYALTLMNSQIVSMNDSEAKSKARDLIFAIIGVDIDLETSFFPAVSQLLLSASYSCFFSDQEQTQQQIISVIQECISNEETDLQKFIKHVALLGANISTENGVPIINQDEAIAIYSEDPIYQNQVLPIISNLIQQRQISNPEQLISFVLDNFLIMTEEEIENKLYIINNPSEESDQLNEDDSNDLNNQSEENEHIVDNIIDIIYVFIANYPDNMDHEKLAQILNLCLSQTNNESLVTEGIFDIRSIILGIFAFFPPEISSYYINILVDFLDSIFGTTSTTDIINLFRQLLCKKHDALDYWNDEMIQYIEKCFDFLDDLGYLDIASLYGVLIQIGRCDISIIQKWLDKFNEDDLTETEMLVKELGSYIIGASAILSGHDIETFLPFLLPILESKYILRDFDSELIHLAFLFLSQQNQDYNKYLEAFRARQPDTTPHFEEPEYFNLHIEYPKVQEYKQQNHQ